MCKALVFFRKQVNCLSQGAQCALRDEYVESSTKAASRSLMPQADSDLLPRQKSSYSECRRTSQCYSEMQLTCMMQNSSDKDSFFFFFFISDIYSLSQSNSLDFSF